MDSSKILYSEGNSDEMYTPSYGVTPILKYIPKNKIVWCPFDTEESEFVKQLQGGGGKLFIVILKIEKIFSNTSLKTGI